MKLLNPKLVILKELLYESDYIRRVFKQCHRGQNDGSMWEVKTAEKSSGTTCREASNRPFCFPISGHVTFLWATGTFVFHTLYVHMHLHKTTFEKTVPYSNITESEMGKKWLKH